MARCLTKEDVIEVVEKLPAYDAELVRKTGLSLKDIATRSMGVSEEKAKAAIASHKVAVVPITAGEGVVEYFSEAVTGILNYLGADVFKTSSTDIAGVAEGVEKGADIVFFADDNRFIALNLALRKVIDNAESTAKGYATALEAMAGGLTQRKVLVIGGTGRVGWNAVLSLKHKGAKVAAIDLNQDRMESLGKEHKIIVERNLEEALGRYTLFFDASTSANIIQAKHIKPETLIAAPGMPLGLTEEARSLVKERLIQDVLEIGVATMFIQTSCI
ncbi:MAG: 3-methylornithyl-N6-L-lysine dehydrogenase PylD [Dehalococcoidales bacterium]